jgi:serine/threonine-protein kinase
MRVRRYDCVLYVENMIGETVGSYRILGPLGRGGMGVVYRAEHTLMGKRVAVKTLLPELSHDPDILRRFFNEAKAAAQIRHPGIVDIYDFGNHKDGSAYIVMELLEGEALSTLLVREGRLPMERVLDLSQQIASALAAAHGRGIVHRDLKPDNLFLVPDPAASRGERVKILDFGIAKLTTGTLSDSVRTRTGALLGTPTYMSPEQCRGLGELDARSDIYSLGCIVYEMATGQPPFTHAGLSDMISAHMNDAPVPPCAIEPSLPPDLDGVLLRALAKLPDDRFRDIPSLAAALHTLGRVSSTFPPASTTGQGALAESKTVAAVTHTTLGGTAAESKPRTAPRRVGLLAALVVAVAGAYGLWVTMQAPPAPTATTSPGGTTAAAPAPAGEAPTPTAALPVPLDAAVPAMPAVSHGKGPAPRTPSRTPAAPASKPHAPTMNLPSPSDPAPGDQWGKTSDPFGP